MKRVFLDANVLFTAVHNPEGKAAFLFALSASGHLSLFSCDVACEEARRNLETKYPGSLPGLMMMLSKINRVSSDFNISIATNLPQKDAVIFQAAANCHATHFLTGDIRHFGPMMNRPDMACSITVQTVAQFLDEL